MWCKAQQEASDPQSIVSYFGTSDSKFGEWTNEDLRRIIDDVIVDSIKRYRDIKTN